MRAIGLVNLAAPGTSTQEEPAKAGRLPEGAEACQEWSLIKRSHPAGSPPLRAFFLASECRGSERETFSSTPLDAKRSGRSHPEDAYRVSYWPGWDLQAYQGNDAAYL